MGVGRNWVMGVSVVINRGEGNIMRIEETGCFLRFVCKGGICRAVRFLKLVRLQV